jgi:hypothetical protein
MTRALLRPIGATVAACVALLLGAAPAFAHTRLEVTPAVDPQAGARQGEDAAARPWLAAAVVLVGAGAVVAPRLGKGGRR